MTPPDISPSASRFRPYTVRKWAFLLRGEKLICPLGHRLHTNAVFSEHGGMTCQHRAGGQGECGATVWLVCIPGGTFLYEITAREMIFMRDQAMNAQQSLAYLSGAPGQLPKAG